MPELRWILFGFAIVLLAGIYLWGRRTSAQERAEAGRIRPEPTLQDYEERPEQARAQSAPSIAYEGEPAVRFAPLPDSARALAPPPLVPEQESHPSANPVGAVQDTWRGRLEPSFTESFVTEELPVEPAVTNATPSSSAPTLSSGDAPAPRRIERRKILALRLAAAPRRIEGARLLEAFEAESLQHGKYDVYHRLHDDGTSIFSVASMVEPGTFDLEKMPRSEFPGVTMFAQLPGPVPGMHALNELVACARRLQQTLGGTLQDDRGVPLTVHRIERMRQEVREFERPPAQGARGSAAPPTPRY
jgi:cell division protein ZipA